MPETSSQPALLLLGHGSRHHPDAGKPVRQLAGQLHSLGLFSEVHTAFWKEEPFIRDSLGKIKSSRVVVIPFFLSDGYFAAGVVPRELGLLPLPESRTLYRDGQTVFYSLPMGTHPLLAEILLKFAEETTRNVPAKDLSLILVGHGTPQNENSGDSVLELAKILRGKNHFKEVLPAFIDQEPFDTGILGQVQGTQVLVIPFLVSDGTHTRQDIPGHMGFVAPDSPSTPILNPSGSKSIQQLWYARAVGTLPSMQEVALARARESGFLGPKPSRSPSPCTLTP